MSEAPAPESLEELLIQEVSSGNDSDKSRLRNEQVRSENLVAAKFWGPIQYRIVFTFLFFSVIWIGVIFAAATDVVPLWLGLIINSIVASTFYMPMHEATHKNIWGKSSKGRWVEEAIGVASSVPTGINFSSHRAGHMRHHAYTNDPERDPDHFTDGKLSELPKKFYGITMLYSFLPFFALIKPCRVLLPEQFRRVLDSNQSSESEGKSQLRYWLLSTTVLVTCFATGNGLLALMLWWLPARIQLLWLIFIFAWYPHHPANERSRYRHTRVAVFPGSGLLIRGHDHHAMHHLFPRVPHYRLKALWRELSAEMVQRGVRAEGKALHATGPVIW